MPLSYAELEQFYEGLVSRARSRGITCGITSGMACVAFGVAQATKDCDLLCAADAAGELFKVLGEASLGGQTPTYRGPLTPPLDSRWLRGGWTSHFVWDTPGVEAYLDIFGVAPRGSSPWEAELQGCCTGPHTVAEMKRTNRERDWPVATALGVKLLEAGDPRGWLHLFNYHVLVQTVRKLRPPAAMIALRPALALLAEADERLELALKGEVEFWNRLEPTSPEGLCTRRPGLYAGRQSGQAILRSIPCRSASSPSRTCRTVIAGESSAPVRNPTAD